MSTTFTFKSFRDHIRNLLKGLYPEREIHSIIDLLFENKVNLKKSDILLKANEEFPSEKAEEILRLTEELKSGKPLQYVLGSTEFYGYTLNVNSSVLIPRQETEELVQWILQENTGFSGNILDIGTGSGCIAIALADNFPKAKVFALDYDSSIIQQALKNAEQNKVHIKPVVLDILKNSPPSGKYGIIVSNPPYVRDSEKKWMHKNVLDFEPETALFVNDNDPLIFYRRISEIASDYLVSGGKLYFEINEHLADETMRLIKDLHFTAVTLKYDLNNKPRMIKATKP